MEVAVLTSVYGGYDMPVTPKPQTVDADWVFVTDEPIDVPGWRTVHEPRPFLRSKPRLAAKVAKCCPFFFADADFYVWIDGSFSITSSEFLAALEYDAHLYATKHPWRDRLTAEVDASFASTGKYEDSPLKEQVDAYLAAGHPDDWGLWECGLLVQSREHAETVGRAWLAEQVRWSIQDQLSLPFVCRNAGYRPHDLPFPLREHPHLSMRPHARTD